MLRILVLRNIAVNDLVIADQQVAACPLDPFSAANQPPDTPKQDIICPNVAKYFDGCMRLAQTILGTSVQLSYQVQASPMPIPHVNCSNPTCRTFFSSACWAFRSFQRSGTCRLAKE